MSIRKWLAPLAFASIGALVPTRAAFAQAPAAAPTLMGVAPAVMGAAPSKTNAAPVKAEKEKPKEPEPEPLPPAPVRLWLIAPGPNEPWTLRIDNEGQRPVRIPADVRLLELEIDVPVIDPDDAASAVKKKPAPKKKPPKPVKCAVPDAMHPSSFPENRELLLAPGQSYFESFDPRLLCFGKNAEALRGGAVVRNRFGWAPPKVSPWAKKQPQKAPEGPFAAESTDNPPAFAPASQLSAPTIVLSYAKPASAAATADTTKGQQANPTADTTKGQQANPSVDNTTGQQANPTADGAGPKPAPIVDANAPRLAVKAQAFADAAAARNVSITTTAKNAGRRPMLAVLRPRMVGYQVSGPDGDFSCPADPPTHAVPRDMYRKYKPDEATSFTVLLYEECPQGSFSRPGLYTVTPTLYAGESGSELGITAYTAVSQSVNPTLVRVQTGPDPFYANPPAATPTPKPVMPEGDATPE